MIAPSSALVERILSDGDGIATMRLVDNRTKRIKEAALVDRRSIMAGAVAAPIVTALAGFASEPAMAAPVAPAAPEAGSTFKVNIPAGPLWSNTQAQQLGPLIAAAHFGRFTGQWTTVIQGQMSVIEVEFTVPGAGTTSYTMDVPAGPIWNNDDAKLKCPAICASYGGTWNGQWKTVVDGKLSVAGCTFKI
jgi:hypothetical protein